MKHDEAVERVRMLERRGRAYAISPRSAWPKEHLNDAEAFDTLLAELGHIPVGGDGEPLWAGKEPVWTNCGGYVLRWKVIAVEENGVRLSGSAASNKLHIFSKVFSSRRP